MRWRLAAAAAVGATLIIALSPTLDRLSDESFAWHMVQHLLILMLAPLLLLLAQPFRFFSAVAGKQLTANAVRVTRPLHLLASPALTFCVFVAVLWLTHFSGLYELALRKPLIHAGEHALYFCAGLMFWLPVVSPAPLRPLAFPVRLFYLLLAIPQGALLAVALDSARHPLYPHYLVFATPAQAIADQQNAAAVMWIVGGAMLFTAFLIALGSWAKRESLGFACVGIAFCIASVPTTARALGDNGAALYAERCASCHGSTALGTIAAPRLTGSSASIIHFMLDTGRMPPDAPNADEIHLRPAFTPSQIRALVAYVLTLPPRNTSRLPTVSGGDPVRGRMLFAENCAQCHGVAGSGGTAGFSDVAPPLMNVTPLQIAEAIRSGPSVMPRFGQDQLSDRDVDDIARYIGALQTNTGVSVPLDAGGVSLGHVGAVAEGLIGWFFGLGVIVLFVRSITASR